MKRVVIAGTGRAGSSFLVRWLAESGLDCGDLSELGWFEEARAGLERRLDGSDGPLVVKDPWLWSYLDDIDPAWVGVLVVPMRDLGAAAASRVRRELTARHATLPTTIGDTAGGCLWPIEQLDQERVLAAGFYRLVFWALHHNVPTVLVEYPRLVNDPDYAVATLSGALGSAGVVWDAEAARFAHLVLADHRET